MERRQARAVAFVRDVVEDPALAAEIEALSVEEYAQRRGIPLQNPSGGKEIDMPRETREELVEQRDELLDALETAQGALDDAQDAIGDILDTYAPEEDAEPEAD